MFFIPEWFWILFSIHGPLSSRIVVVYHQSRLLVITAETVELEHTSSVLKLFFFLLKIMLGPVAVAHSFNPSRGSGFPEFSQSQPGL